MITLIYGGSASGKSAFAERMVMERSRENNRYYIATMQVYGEEGKRRVQRHVTLRSGKGFQTIECPVNITECLRKIPEPSKAVLLIECAANLAANEMFDSRQSKDAVVEKVTAQLHELCLQVRHTVIVTTNIFEDGIIYDRETTEYVHCLGQINRFLAGIADEVIEVIAGLPAAIANTSSAPIPKSACEDERIGIQTMRLVIGGYAQGKKEYITRQLSSQNFTYYLIDENGPALSDIPQETRAVVLNHLHLIIRKLGTEEAARDYLRQLMDLCRSTDRQLIIISDEVGNGVIPLQEEDRDFREHAGRILCDLARQAHTVERIICGIPQTLS